MTIKSKNTGSPWSADVSSASESLAISESMSAPPISFNQLNLLTTSPDAWSKRGYLPHFDSGEVVQFITLRLYDSVPVKAIKRWEAELNVAEANYEDSEKIKILRALIDDYADTGHGQCFLGKMTIAKLVVDALKFFDGKKYSLIAWSVMPNHLHVLLQTEETALSKIIKDFKSYTAHQANKILERTGMFWAPDYFDRFIRNQKHYDYTLKYIRNNPVKARCSQAYTGSIYDEEPLG